MSYRSDNGCATWLQKEVCKEMPLILIDLSNMEFEAIDGLIPIQTKTPYCREENEGFYSLLGNDGINNYIMLNNTGYKHPRRNKGDNGDGL